MRHPKIAAKIEGTQTSSILVCFGGNNRSMHVIVNCYPNCYGPMVWLLIESDDKTKEYANAF